MHIKSTRQFRAPRTKGIVAAILLGFVGGYVFYGTGVTSAETNYILVRSTPPASVRDSMHIAITPESQCKTRLEQIVQRLEKACPQCAVKIAECRPHLDERYQVVLDNEPFSVSYFTVPSPQERHFVWGLSPSAQKDYCALMKEKYPSGRCIVPR
jgi:hypothetical protein